MVSNVEAQQFQLLFMGKNNTYVKNELPKEKPEAGTKIKTKIINVEGKVDKDLLVHHLEGDYGVGICPVNTEGKCHFAVLDIDYYTAKTRKMFDIIREYQLPLLPFRSKSGGLHVYIFLKKTASAKSVRDVLNKVVYYFSLESMYGKGKVEVFPKQEKAEGFGSSITLPYFNCENPYTYLMDLEGNKIDFRDALQIISKKQTTLEDVETALDNLPYNDAPPCIQRILLSEEVGSEDSGRNNFLFSFAVYAKKKYGAGFETYVEEVNNRFQCPLESTVIEQICASVRNNEYPYKCKDIPCNAFCDKVMCKKREFGLGRAKGHFTGIDYGQLYRYKTAEPYYIWKLRLQGQEEWKDVVFKDERFLLDQRNFAMLCVRYLNQAPMLVSPNDWYAILNSVLPKIQDVEVKEESDTSGLSDLHFAFVSYLTNKQARRDCPYQIHMGLSVFKEVNGVKKYYFTHRGFYGYLRNQKISFDMSLMRETLKNFGAKEDILTYTNSLNEVVSFPCWSKEDDTELTEAYSSAMEIENGDKASMGALSLGEASNVETKEETAPAYSEEDKKQAENLL